MVMAGVMEVLAGEVAKQGAEADSGVVMVTGEAVERVEGSLCATMQVAEVFLVVAGVFVTGVGCAVVSGKVSRMVAVVIAVSGEVAVSAECSGLRRSMAVIMPATAAAVAPAFTAHAFHAWPEDVDIECPCGASRSNWADNLSQQALEGVSL